MKDERIQHEQYKLSYYSFLILGVLMAISFFISFFTKNLLITQIGIIGSFVVVGTYYTIVVMKRGLLIKKENKKSKEFVAFLLCGIIWMLISFLFNEINNLKGVFVQLIIYFLFSLVAFPSIRYIIGFSHKRAN